MKYENKDSPYIWPVGLGKISSSSFDLGRGGGDGSQFPNLGVPQRKDMKHVNYKIIELVSAKNCDIIFRSKF